MWKKRTNAEIAEAMRARPRRRKRMAIGGGVLVFVIMLFLFGGIKTAERGRFFVPLDEIPRRIPGAFFAGVLVGVIGYAFYREKRFVICSKCGATKYPDKSPRCACGGHFENLDEMKWVNKKN